MIPALIAQKRYRRSKGFLTAVLNLTIDSAPTIPRETRRFDCIATIIAATVTVIPARVTVRSFE